MTNEKRNRRKEAQERWIKAHPGRRMQISRRHYYGIEPEEYESKKKAQRNRCALCNKSERRIDRRSGKRQSLSVDHDHKTGRNRGLLCGDCNRGLGLFFDSVAILLRAIKYLKKYKE